MVEVQYQEFYSVNFNRVKKLCDIQTAKWSDEAVQAFDQSYWSVASF